MYTEAMHDLLYAAIRNTPPPISRKSSFMMTQSQFLAKLSPIPDEPPSYDMKAVTKRNKA